MKFSIICLPTKNTGNQLPNLGAIVIAQRVRELGHDVFLIDAARYRITIEDAVMAAAASNPDLIGISGIITSYYYCEPLTVRLKQALPDVPLVVGGGITCVADLIETHTPVEYLIKGEGEMAITELVSILDAGRRPESRDIPGLFVRVGGTFKKPSGEQSYPDLSFASFPAYDLYDMEYYIDSMTHNAYRFLKLYPHIYEEVGEGIRFFPLTLTRGCPFNCKFCYRLVKKFRHPAIENAVSHLKTAKDRYGCLGITQLDELTVANRQWFLDFCDAVAAEVPGLKIFSGAGRANLLTPEIIRYARKAGFIRFGCGIESGSQRILDNLNKKVTVKQNYDAIKDVKAAGMMATCNFIFGTPGESKKTLKETERFILETLDPRDYAINLVVPYPETPLFDHAIEKKILKKSEIHDYILNVSFGEYPLNLSEFKSGDRLVRAVSLMHSRLMIRFMWKKGNFLDIIRLVLVRIRQEIGFVLKMIAPKRMSGIRAKRNDELLNDFDRKRQAEYRQWLSTVERKQK